MSNVSVHVNMGDFGATMQQWVNGLAQKVDARTQEAGINVQANAKINCPVGTPESTHKKGYHGGRLRQSIQYVNMGTGHSGVGSTVYYAGFVDGGTKFMKARPFLTNAFINERAAWKRDLQDMV
jgi:HK97 gp10 family phage protein